MTPSHYNQMIDLSTESTGIFPIDSEEEETCIHCDGDGCEVCNWTGLEFPEETNLF